MFENLLQNPVYMLGIVAAAVIILIVLVMKFKVNAFVSLLIVSVLSAFAAGMTPGDTLASITGGMGKHAGRNYDYCCIGGNVRCNAGGIRRS